MDLDGFGLSWMGSDGVGLVLDGYGLIFNGFGWTLIIFMEFELFLIDSDQFFDGLKQTPMI